MNFRFLLVPAVALALSLAPSSARATPMDFDFSGNFTFDNDVLIFSFSVSAPSLVTVFSSSWLQGEPPAGFDPMLGIWDAAGNNLAFQDDGGNAGTTLSNGVPYNHGVWDSYYTVMLGAGSYFASVTQFNNFPVGTNLAQGFTYDGNPNFTFDNGWGAQPFFNGVWDIPTDPRTSFWQFHLLNVDQAQVNTVPEPASVLLLGVGLLGVGLAARRRHSA